MLRTIRRWFSDAEVKTLADEVDRMIDQHQAYGHKLEGLSLRLERFMNRTQMRLARAGVPNRAELDDEDAAILAQLKEAARNGEGEAVVTLSGGGRDLWNGR